MAKKAATTLLSEARQELVETNAKLSDTGRRHDQLLLAGDERGLDAIEQELASLQKAAVRQADRIRLLEEQARQEEAAAVVKRRADVVVRFEKKLAEADREADELQNLLAQAEKKFRRIIELRSDARAAWPIGDSHANAVLHRGRRRVVGRRCQAVAVLAPVQNRRSSLQGRHPRRNC
jgi:hypothetical protein